MNRLPARPLRRHELIAHGLSSHDVEQAVRDGDLRRPFHGVYLPSGLALDPIQRARAAALVLPPHCVVTDRSAAWIHGVDCFDPGETARSADLEIASYGGADRTRRQSSLGGKRALHTAEICEVGGVRLTTPLRTACDVACLFGRHRGLAVLDQFRRSHGLQPADFDRILPRYRGRRGVIQLRELVARSDPRAESPAESWTRMSVIDAGLPAPSLQIEVYLDGYGWARLDLGYEQLKVGIEYDGVGFHTSATDRGRDSERRRALRAAGWVVVVVRKDGFRPPDRDRWLGEVGRAVEARTSPTTKRIYSRGPSRAPYRRPRART